VDQSAEHLLRRSGGLARDAATEIIITALCP
jgi:hypothetical protein